MANEPHAHRRFSRIETRGVLPDGRVITSWFSFPRGVGKDVYDRIVEGSFRAFGKEGTRVEGTFMDEPAAAR